MSNHHPCPGVDYEHGEVLRLDGNGHVVVWDAVDCGPLATGETPEAYDLEFMTAEELRRIGRG